MLDRYGFVITNDGLELITKLVAGDTLNISNVLVGTGLVGEYDDPREYKGLIQPKARASSTKPSYDGSNVRMIVEYRSDMNGGLDEGFWLREFGVFAIDPDKGEVLVYYGCLGDYPQYVSPISETGVDVRRFPICISIGKGVTITADYECEAWMTAENVEEYCLVTVLPMFIVRVREMIDEHDADPNAHNALANKINELESRVRTMELVLTTDVTENTFVVTFESLDGVSAYGVWNDTNERMEF